MEPSKQKGAVISTGTTSLVLIFVLLCMLTFSVLSLVSAQADLRLSRKSAQRTTDYYAAENAANDILIRIEAAAERALRADRPGRTESFAGLVLEALEGEEPVFLTEEGRLAYQVPLGETQALYVELELSPAELAPGRHYKILAWQTVSQYDWEDDNRLNVLTLDNMPTGQE